MSTRIEAYKFVVTWEGDPIAGLETTQLKIKPNFEEELLKANEGEAAKTLKDFTTEVVISGKTYDGSAGEATFETFRELYSGGTEGTMVYGDPAGETVTSEAKVVAYNEDSESLPVGTWSATLRAVKGTEVFSND